MEGGTKYGLCAYVVISKLNYSYIGIEEFSKCLNLCNTVTIATCDVDCVTYTKERSICVK